MQVKFTCANDKDTIDRILGELTSVEKKVACARFVWDENVVVYPNQIIDPRTRQQYPKSKLEIANSGLSLQFDDKQRVLYRNYLLNPTSDPPSNAALSGYSYDGSVVASYDPPTNKPHGQGILKPGKNFGEYNNFNLWPFLIAVRAMSEQGIGLGGATLEVEKNDNEDPSRTVLLWQGSHFDRRFVFAEKADQLAISRVEQWNHRILPNGKKDQSLSASIEVTEHLRDELGLFLPKRWTISQFSGPDGDLRKKSECVLTEYSLNDEGSLESFSLSPFPEGTLVVDERDETVGWQRDGKIQRMSSDSPAELPPVTQPPVISRTWIFVLNGALLLVVGAVFLMSRRQK